MNKRLTSVLFSCFAAATGCSDASESAHPIEPVKPTQLEFSLGDLTTSVDTSQVTMSVRIGEGLTPEEAANLVLSHLRWTTYPEGQTFDFLAEWTPPRPLTPPVNTPKGMGNQDGSPTSITENPPGPGSSSEYDKINIVLKAGSPVDTRWFQLAYDNSDASLGGFQLRKDGQILVRFSPLSEPVVRGAHLCKKSDQLHSMGVGFSEPVSVESLKSGITIEPLAPGASCKLVDPGENPAGFGFADYLCTGLEGASKSIKVTLNRLLSASSGQPVSFLNPAAQTQAELRSSVSGVEIHFDEMPFIDDGFCRAWVP